MRAKIAYFIPAVNLAGTTTQAFAFCGAMQEAGYDVELIAATKRGVFLDAANTKPYRVTYLHSSKFFAAVSTVFYLTRYLLKNKPDILMAGAKRSNMLAIIAHLLSMRLSRLIVILTNDLSQRKGTVHKGRTLSKALHVFMYRFANHVIVLTSAMQDILLKSGYKPSNVTVIAPPLNIPRIEQKSLQAANHPWLAQAKSGRDIPVVLAVGRIAPQKNYSNLINAIATVNETRPIRLIILGTGKINPTKRVKDLVLKHGLTDKVDFAQFSDNPYSYMQDVDALALSSHWEGFGIVLAEALACGLTIASTDCPHGPREILGGGAFGYLAAPNDPEDLARALLKAVAGPLDPKVLKLRAAEYNGKIIASKYQTLIDDLLDPCDDSKSETRFERV